MKRGQTTIFVILGIVLVMIVFILFVFRGQIKTRVSFGESQDVEKQFSQCVEKTLREKIRIISEQGGYASNKLNLTFQFNEEKDKTDISYLCYQQNNYLPCINQQPMLITHLKKEVREAISGEVENCFKEMVKNVESTNEDVKYRYEGFDLNLYSGRVVLLVNGEISSKKADTVSKYSNLKSVYYTNFYDLAIVAQEIVSQEARFCNFEQVGYSLIYPEYKIHKFRTGNSDTIYTITHTKSLERFRFVVRSCVIPPGF
jgi:hypothetical protein